MNKILCLIIIVTFSSCRYFNVSPVDGITTKNLTEKPLSEEFIGSWKIDKYSYELIEKKEYKQKNVKLIIKNDGSFAAKNFPDFVNVFSENKMNEYINANGTWKIGKDFKGEKWTLSLDFNKSEYFSTEFELYRQDEKLILWYFVGDPDSGERLLFEKE